MATIEMVAEEDAKGAVRDVYDDINETLGLDFVPNMYRVMAVKPAFLEAKWSQIKEVMSREGKSGCDY
jgi:hypothetical protein